MGFLKKWKNNLFASKSASVRSGRSVSEMSKDEIVNYKSSAWQGQSRVKDYREAVEHQYFESVTLDFFTRHLAGSEKVLDMGAGTGRLSLKLAELGCRVTALDISQEMLDELQRVGGNNIVTVNSSADALPFADNSFDAIVQMDFLIHFPTWRDILREEARVCKPGGVIISNFINADALLSVMADSRQGVAYLTNGDFYASCTRVELDEVCAENGLTVLAVYPYNYLQLNIQYALNLNPEEAKLFRQLLGKSLQAPKFLDIIARFEKEIVSQLPAEEGTAILFVLQKNDAAV